MHSFFMTASFFAMVVTPYLITTFLGSGDAA